MFSSKEEYLYFPIEFRQCLINKKEKKKIIKIKRPLIQKQKVKNIIVLTFSDYYREPEEIILTQYKLLYLIDENDPLYNSYETEEEINNVILNKKYKKNLFSFLITIGLDFADNNFIERISNEIFDKGKLNYFDFKFMRYRYTVEFKLNLLKFLPLSLEPFITFPLIKYLNWFEYHIPNKKEFHKKKDIKLNILLKKFIKFEEREINFFCLNIKESSLEVLEL